MSQRGEIRVAIMVATFGAGLLLARIKTPLNTGSFPLWLLLLQPILAFIASVVIMRGKYKNVTRPLTFPSIDGPLFEQRLPLQDELDSALLTFSFGFGGFFWVYVLKNAISLESLVGIGWAAGGMLGLSFFLKKPPP
jgi:hypothetical protein